MSGEGISFRELLQYNRDETRRWLEWFGQNPAALDVPIGAAGSETATMRGLLAHIFFCELFYAELLSDKRRPLAEYEKIPHHTLEDVSRIARSADQLLSELVANAAAESMSAVISIGWPPEKPLTGTKRKMLAHVLLHSLRHWAQIAMTLRQHGFRAEWGHDLLFSEALQ